VKCEYRPELVDGAIGMFHCPECGDMVLAGLEHPDYDSLFHFPDNLEEQE
jgi:hypothetical protein